MIKINNDCQEKGKETVVRVKEKQENEKMSEILRIKESARKGIEIEKEIKFEERKERVGNEHILVEKESEVEKKSEKEESEIKDQTNVRDVLSNMQVCLMFSLLCRPLKIHMTSSNFITFSMRDGSD